MIKKNDWVNISSEKYRTYVFPGNERVQIREPQMLYVSENGHRILDSIGVSHYVPKGWIHLYWLAKEGEPAFVA